MKRRIGDRVTEVVVSLLVLGGAAGAAMADGPDLTEVARRIVHTSAEVKPGDVVVVYGGQHTIPLMEAIAIEAREAGGMVNLFLNTDRRLRHQPTAESLSRRFGVESCPF